MGGDHCIYIHLQLPSHPAPSATVLSMYSHAAGSRAAGPHACRKCAAVVRCEMGQCIHTNAP
eukprot:353858-Chlamydomonas_euryale.AAC.2